MRKIIAILLLITALLLCACDESEPLAPGESALSDVELDKSEIIEGGWPADLLPEGFPEPEYTEIYSVERKDNEVQIIMFAENDQTNPPSPCSQFIDTLVDNYGYVALLGAIDEPDTDMKPVVNKQGIKVIFYDTRYLLSPLKAIESPTGYTYKICISKIAVDDIAYIFWEYPSADTDLGLEEKTFNEWPTEYLPEEFPNPEKEPNTKIKITKMEQKKTGVYITIEGTLLDVVGYKQSLYQKYGYNQDSHYLYTNKNSDYIYITTLQHAKDRDEVQIEELQINKCNDHVKKD